MEKDRILYYMEEAYSSSIWQLPDDFLSFEAYMEVLYDLDRSSSPGYPYCQEKPTIGEWLGFNPFTLEFSEASVHRLWSDVQLVLSGDFEHVFRVFVKMEPHKREKVEQGRWRLIIASALPIQVVWSMCFRYQQKLEIKNAYHLPSQQGLILSSGGWKYFYAMWKNNGFNVGLDKSAWDWTFPYWMLCLDLELCYRLGRGAKMEEWRRITEWLHNDAFCDSRLMLSDGRIFDQQVPGFMKSGLYCTISKNSRGTIMAHIYNCMLTGARIHPLPAAVGDDSLQREDQSTDLSGYQKMGIVVKSVTKGLEFVGHDFKDTGPVPVYMPKHIAKLVRTNEDTLEQYLESMARMYCHDDYNFGVWSNIAKRLNVRIHSQRYYLMWYDYEGL